jgi:DNA-binding protein H-NS
MMISLLAYPHEKIPIVRDAGWVVFKKVGILAVQNGITFEFV